MRLIYILTLFSFFGFSQTNEVLINQALQTAESQNISTQAQAIQALKASGMTEFQARQLAAQRGLGYDQLQQNILMNLASEFNNNKIKLNKYTPIFSVLMKFLCQMRELSPKEV